MPKDRTEDASTAVVLDHPPAPASGPASADAPALAPGGDAPPELAQEGLAQEGLAQEGLAQGDEDTGKKPKPPALKEQPEGALWSIAARVLTSNPLALPAAEPDVAADLVLESLDPATAEPILAQAYFDLLCRDPAVVVDWETPLRSNASWVHALWRTLSLQGLLRPTMCYYVNPDLVAALHVAHPLRALLPFARPPVLTQYLPEDLLIIADAVPICPVRTGYELRAADKRKDLVVHVGWKLNSVVAIARHQPSG